MFLGWAFAANYGVHVAIAETTRPSNTSFVANSKGSIDILDSCFTSNGCQANCLDPPEFYWQRGSDPAPFIPTALLPSGLTPTTLLTWTKTGATSKATAKPSLEPDITRETALISSSVLFALAVILAILYRVLRRVLRGRGRSEPGIQLVRYNQAAARATARGTELPGNFTRGALDVLPRAVFVDGAGRILSRGGNNGRGNNDNRDDDNRFHKLSQESGTQRTSHRRYVLIS